MKKVAFGLSIVVAAMLVLADCGGGGDSGTATSTVSGTVQASLLKGVKVCEEGKDNCAITDENGKFTLKNVVLPAKLEVKVGDSVLNTLSVDTASIDITPIKLADNNATLASYIGAMLHMSGNCALTQTTGTCDLSGVTKLDVDPNSNLSLMEEIRNKLKESNSFEIMVNAQNMTLGEDNATLYAQVNPLMVGETPTYVGALNAGDFAEFKYDPNDKSIQYSINGSVMGDVSGKRYLGEGYHNVFFLDKDNPNISYFFSGGLGVADIVDDQNIEHFVVGLQGVKEIDATKIINKRYIYVSFEPNVQTPSFKIVDINGTDGSSSGTLTIQLLGDIPESLTGTWEVDDNHLVIKDDNGNPLGNAILKPGSSRVGFIFDAVDGGFGIGLEAKEMSAADLEGTYYYLDEGEDECLGVTEVNATGGFSWSDEMCNGKAVEADDEDSHGFGSLALNCLEWDPTAQSCTTSLPGIAQILDPEGNPTSEYAIMDAQDGYYISVNADEGFLSIGSNKPLQ